jgi:tight adherence protein C
MNSPQNYLREILPLSLALLLVLIWLVGCLLTRESALAAYGELLREHTLRRFITFPAYALKATGYAARLAYDRKIKVHIVEYYGKAESETLFLLHQAGKLTYVAAALVFCLLIASRSKADAGYVFFCLLMLSAAFALPDSRLSAEINKRKLDIMIDFPDFLVKLTLLINAGMNVTGAWERVSEGTKKDRALGRELDMALREIRSGKSESKAYEDFAKRCRIQEITRVVSVLLQNMKKGNAELVSILRVHANECWEMRKNAAKKLGEEASSKMLLQMAIMLLSILLIVTTPAILALQGLI